MKRTELLERLVALSDAAQDGDLELVRHGLADLVGDLELGGRRSGAGVCPHCGLDVRWPGLLDAHLRVSHPEAWEASLAA